jgi:hypothetical protein
MEGEWAYADGDHVIKTLGGVCIDAQGYGVDVLATGLEGSISVGAETSIGMYSGEATVSLVNDEVGGCVTIAGGEAGKISHVVGPPEAGAMLEMLPEMIMLSVGPLGEGASITLTPESIIFKVAEVTYMMTPASITEMVAEVTREMTPEGHNLTAAETEFNVGVTGEAKELPTEAAEVEGGVADNATMSSYTSDAMKNDDAGIMMQV